MTASRRNAFTPEGWAKFGRGMKNLIEETKGVEQVLGGAVIDVKAAGRRLTLTYADETEEHVDLPLATEKEDGAMSKGDKYRLNELAKNQFRVAVPHQNGTMTYNGSIQTPAWTETLEHITIGGVTTATDAGTYQVTFTLAEGYFWADGTEGMKTEEWTIGQASLSSVPQQYGTLTYNGGTQNPTWTEYDPLTMTASGETEETDAGTYTVRWTPSANYKWGDGSAYKEATWSIGKLALAKPALTDTSYTYAKDTERTPGWTDFNTDHMTKGGTYHATAAGSYTATVSLKNKVNTEWTDGSTADVELSWSIGKLALAKPALAETVFTYDEEEHTPTWTGYEADYMTKGGTLSADGIGSYTATCALSDKVNTEWADGTTADVELAWQITRIAIPTVPSQTGTLTYNGSEQEPSWSGYDTDKMTIGGVTAATNAGAYTASFTPKTGYCWSDDTTAAKEVTWSIGQQDILLTPSQTGTLTYNGSEREPSWSGYDTDKMTIGGTVSGTDAGNYTATFTPKANYRWSDGSASKSVTWTIEKLSLTKPSLTTESYTYDGNTKTPGWNNFDADYMTKGGTYSSVNAGSFTATAELTDAGNTQWTDASTGTVELEWSIAKAAGTIVLSKNSVSLDRSAPSDAVTITYNGDGTLSVSSSDLSVATATLSDTTITIEAVATGDATVTVNAAGTNNYEACTATVSVTAALAPVVSENLNDNSWDTISAVALEGTGDTYWDVGDCKEITLNGKVGDYLTLSNQKLCVFILDFNHKMNGADENNIIFGCFKTALTGGVDVALCDSKYNSTSMDGSICFNMNHRGTESGSSGTAGYYGSNYGGWKGTDLRYDVLGATSSPPSEYNSLKSTSNVGYDATAATLKSPKADTFLAALPSDLRSKLRLWTRWVDAVGNKSNIDANVKATVDAVTLLAEFEIFGSRSYANSYEKNHQTQMKYYSNGNSKVKYKHNATDTAAGCWECSPLYDTAGNFCFVNTSGNATGNAAHCVRGLGPAFKI